MLAVRPEGDTPSEVSLGQLVATSSHDVIKGVRELRLDPMPKSDCEISCGRVVDYDCRGGFLGMKLGLIAQADTDPIGFQQFQDLSLIFQSGAGGITE